MSRAQKVRYLGSVQGQGAARGLLKAVGDAVIDVRGIPRSLVMLCPDGCGQTLSVNLDRRAGKAWRLFIQDENVTLYPSVWRHEGCEAHFILWRGHILWCDDREKDLPWHDEALTRRVLEQLKKASPRPLSYVDMAETLDAIPWEVYWACTSLVADGLAERNGEQSFLVSST